jgi:acetyltransferase
MSHASQHSHFLTSLFDGERLVFVADDSAHFQTCVDLAIAMQRNQFAGKVDVVGLPFADSERDVLQQADVCLIAVTANLLDDLASELQLRSRERGRLRCAVVVPLLDTQTQSATETMLTALGIQFISAGAVGLQRPHRHLSLGRTGGPAAPGNLALVSQSGALTASILDWAAFNHVGFSLVATGGKGKEKGTSHGRSAQGMVDLLDFLAADRRTNAVVLYLEHIELPRAFMSALRYLAALKPVVVLKGGVSQAGASLALTHSGAMHKDDDAIDTALRRAGAVRVQSFLELFAAAKALAMDRRPTGERIAIVANGGGPAVLAADRAQVVGIPLATLDEAASDLQLKRGAIDNPLDLGARATSDQFAQAVNALSTSEHVDAVLAIYAPLQSERFISNDAVPSANAALQVAEALIQTTQANLSARKPVLACFMGEAAVQQARERLASAGLPAYRTPDAAIGAFAYMAQFQRNQQLLQQVPPPISGEAQPDIEGAQLLVDGVLEQQRKLLSEYESKALLRAFHINCCVTLLTRSAIEAVAAAEQIGFPVVLKIDSPDVVHKSDVGGVLLDLRSAAEVRAGYTRLVDQLRQHAPDARVNGVTVQPMLSRQGIDIEVNVGVFTDALFGPLISFGLGGTKIEVLADRALELPPLNGYLARRLIERSRAWQALKTFASPQAIQQLEQIVRHVSDLVCTMPNLVELDINPIIVSQHAATAVDARAVIAPHTRQRDRFEHLAITPYPAHLTRRIALRDSGVGEYVLRPIRPDDGERLQAMVQQMSPEARYFRFVQTINQLPARMLARYTLIDYNRSMAFVAVIEQDGKELVVGVSRYVLNSDGQTCEFALAVADAWNGKGIGTQLMHAVIDSAKHAGLRAIEGLVLRNNDRMLKFIEKLGFSNASFEDDPDMRLVVKQL